jgi:hypothetical protein
VIALPLISTLADESIAFVQYSYFAAWVSFNLLSRLACWQRACFRIASLRFSCLRAEHIAGVARDANCSFGHA